MQKVECFVKVHHVRSLQGRRQKEPNLIVVKVNLIMLRASPLTYREKGGERDKESLENCLVAHIVCLPNQNPQLTMTLPLKYQPFSTYDLLFFLSF